ncbi:equilibrioception [Mactra antiquata]
MEQQQKVLTALTFVFSLIAIVFTVVSLGTDNWVESTPRLIQNGTERDSYSKFNFGLFKGHRDINYGNGARSSELSVVCEPSHGVCVVYGNSGQEALTAEDYIAEKMSNRTDEALYKLGLVNYGLWVTPIICAAVSMVFGFISMGFAVFNICGKPIETITGPMGLYLWNGIAFIFALLDMIVYLALFLSTWKKNFLLQSDIDKFSIEDYTDPGYSFYLVPGAVVLYMMNIILLICSGYKFRCSFRSEAEKVVDNGVILY